MFLTTSTPQTNPSSDGRWGGGGGPGQGGWGVVIEMPLFTGLDYVSARYTLRNHAFVKLDDIWIHWWDLFVLLIRFKVLVGVVCLVLVVCGI